MNGRRIFSNPRRRAYRIALVVTSVVVFVVITVVASGCGSAKKNTSRHGGGIAYVKVLPGKQALRQGTTTTIVLKRNLTFVVGVLNDGDNPEQNVKVTLVIHQVTPAPSITRTLTIPQISNGATQEVDFHGPFNIRTLISVVPITVDVRPVPGELNTANNTATYNARFAFGVVVAPATG